MLLKAAGEKPVMIPKPALGCDKTVYHFHITQGENVMSYNNKVAAKTQEISELQEQMKRVSKELIEVFVDIVKSAEEVYQQIPISEVPTEEVNQVVRSLVNKVGLHGNTRKYTEPPKPAAQRKKEQEQKIIDIIEENGYVTRKQATEMLGVSQVTGIKRLEDMAAAKKIWKKERQTAGRGRATIEYRL